jgi:hypothetical protein
MKYILIVMMALLVIGCGDTGGDDANSTVVNSNVTTPPVNVVVEDVPDTQNTYNEFNVTIVMPENASSGSSSSSDGTQPCDGEISGCSQNTVTTNTVPTTNSCINPSSSCPNGCPTMDGCGRPVNFFGDGGVANPYQVFANGAVPVKGETWTYYRIDTLNQNCTFKITLPIYVTSYYVYDENLSDVNYTFSKGAIIFDTNNSVVFIDCYALSFDEIEIYTECWTERR